MSLADELLKMDDLRRRGALSDEEFARAKAALLEGSGAAAAQVANATPDHLAEIRTAMFGDS